MLGLLFSALLCLGALGQIIQERYEHLSKVELWPSRDVGLIQSMNYPMTMPPNVNHIWMINGVPNSIISVRCSEITQQPDCSTYNVTLIDGNNAGTVCGNQRDVQIESRTATLILVIGSGPMGGSRVSCVASSTLRYGNIPSYLTDVSREVNSAEHGGSPGRKATTCRCGWTNKPTHKRRIVGGSVTGVNEYPLAVSLIEVKNRVGSNMNYFRFCGGTIISAWHVLTAAHCTVEFIRNRNKELALILGDHDHTRWDETDANVIHFVERIVNHEAYNHQTHQNDIALLKSRTQFQFSDKVGPACMPTGRMNLQGQYIKGVGWGLTAHPGTGSNVLKKVWIQVLPLETCAPFYLNSVNLGNRHQLCVFGKQRGLCMGDSGGPVIYLDPETNRYTLVGVVSFGRSCSDFYPDIVTDVSTFLPWIRSKMASTMPSAGTCTKQ